MCEGGQVWGHARRRGYATAEIWPKSDFDIAGVQKIEVSRAVSRAVSREVSREVSGAVRGGGGGFAGILSTQT